MNIGINTFGLGPYLRRDGERIWSDLYRAGVRQIEPCVALHKVDPMPDDYRAVWEKGLFDGIFEWEDAPKRIADLRAMGFTVTGFQLQRITFCRKELEAVIPFMQHNGLNTCIYSFMERSVDKITCLANTIREAVRLFQEHGFEFLIHNHDMEWLPDGDTCVMRWLLTNIPELRYEIDLGWALYADVDVVKLLEEYPERFPILHIKEIARGAKAWNNSPFCTAPGEGILPLKAIMDIAKTMHMGENGLVIDQDDSVNGDIVGDIARGVINIKRFYGDE